MNIILFCRVLYADFRGILKLNKKSIQKEGIEKEPEKEKEPKEPKAKEEDEAEDGTEEGIVDITDFTDLKTYRDIPNFSKLPTWLQDMITEHQTVFTNQLSSKSIMNVEPVTFSLRDNIRIPDKNITAHLPPANLRASADRLLDKLESGGLIKKAPRLCKYKSKAFFKPKKNQELSEAPDRLQSFSS